MVYRNFYFHIIARVAILLFTCLAIAWQWSRESFDILVFILSGFLAIQVVLLIRYINRTNQLLAFFFDAVKNEDSSLVFTEMTGNKQFNELHHSLNKLNEMLRDIRMEITIQEKYYQAIVESTGTGILTFGKDGRIELANSALKEMFGFENLHHIKQFERICPRFAQKLKEIETEEQASISCIARERPLHLSMKAGSLKLRDKRLTLVAVQDIKQEMDEQELESWQKLIRILNHEIMNTVAPITSLSETLSSFYTKEGQAVSREEVSNRTIIDTLKGLSVITEHGKGLIRFVESYRSLSKLPKPELRECEVSLLFERMHLLAGSLASRSEAPNKKPVKIEDTIVPEDLIILADENLIAQVLFNLVKNAMEALRECEDPRIHLEAGQDATGRPWIKVQDNGEGIQEEEQEKVFVPFYTTKNAGSGIGLALSRQIMRMHKGKISLTSTEGQGTSILLQF